MMVERLQHLEVLASSDDAQMVAQHKSIARWIDQFFSTTEGIDTQLKEARKGLSERENADFDGSEFMAPAG